ncbi:hypothetical protein [Parafilimonas sp.]|uniref:hypothetical protein n=1 Tax=Parafilimonas sp. TaxID=1969739 RepID=UPI0039E2201B
MKKAYPLLAFAFVFQGFTMAQSAAKPDIPLVRVYFHEKIDSTQKLIKKLDGKKDDDSFKPSDNDDLNNRLNDALTAQVDALQDEIEASKIADNNDKIRYLRGLNEALRRFYAGFRYQTVKSPVLLEVVSGYKNCMELDQKKSSIFPEIKKHSYDAGDILVNSYAFNDNEGLNDSKDFLTLKVCSEHPERMMTVLSGNPDFVYADSLIVVAAHTRPDDLYTYAGAYNKFAERIRSNPDSLVQLISRIAKMPTGRMFFPFLDNLSKNKISFEQVETALKDDAKYYALLVKTEIDYADRVRRRDTPISMIALQGKLTDKAKEVYVNVINGLHESPDNVRFKKIANLTPEELYYLAVMTEDEIYTSSYTHGVYPFIWKEMKTNKGGDSLLLRVRFDHFRKWIKMAANYNTLDDFLKRMDKGNAQILMKAFVNGLEKSPTLEDAVDVADSYASIDDKAIQGLVLSQVQYNLEQSKQNVNTKAENIYNILNTLFLSIDSSNHINLSEKLGIPPIYFMPNKDMRDDSGRIIIQQFFYGDEDGKTYFPLFVNSFRNANWKIQSNNQWVTITSTKGVPVSIYSNKPLDEKLGLDAEAQSALNQYLYDRDLNPTMVIHRGHSYWLPSTLDQLSDSARLVMLGSCGAYQNLNKVLQICPTAQIISSKQTGAGNINQPMINTIIDELRQGKNLDWPSMWKRFGALFNHGDLFNDYVPPYRNLGAVFIMAYQKEQMNEEN